MDRFPNLSGKRKAYAATTSALDDGVGEVLADVQRLGQENNTIIVFINDNGGPIVDTAASNAPLSGTKGSLWEGGIRVPFLFQWRGTFQEGVTRNGMASALDIFPTLLAAAKVPVPAGKDFDGSDLVPFLEGHAESISAERTLFWRMGGQWAIRRGDWKLVFPEHGSPKPLLFNLKDDIGENHDLSASNPDIVKQLNTAWEKWDEQNLPLPTGYKRGQANEKCSPIPLRDAFRLRDDDT